MVPDGYPHGDTPKRRASTDQKKDPECLASAADGGLVALVFVGPEPRLRTWLVYARLVHGELGSGERAIMFLTTMVDLFPNGVEVFDRWAARA